MTDTLTQTQVNQTAWAACDTFRGVVDAGQYKDYILVMLFLKYTNLLHQLLPKFRLMFPQLYYRHHLTLPVVHIIYYLHLRLTL